MLQDAEVWKEGIFPLLTSACVPQVLEMSIRSDWGGGGIFALRPPLREVVTYILYIPGLLKLYTPNLTVDFKHVLCEWYSYKKFMYE